MCRQQMRVSVWDECLLPHTFVYCMLYLHLHLYMYMYMCICMCVYMYTHTYMYVLLELYSFFQTSSGMHNDNDLLFRVSICHPRMKMTSWVIRASNVRCSYNHCQSLSLPFMRRCPPERGGHKHIFFCFFCIFRLWQNLFLCVFFPWLFFNFSRKFCILGQFSPETKIFFCFFWTFFLATQMHFFFGISSFSKFIKEYIVI